MPIGLTSRIVLIALALFACVPTAAQKPTPTRPPERNREIVELLNDARFAAPELTVDTFLKAVESKTIKDEQWWREIIEEALRTADEVKYPVRKQRAFHGTGTVDTVSGYLTYAYDLHLDSLSLKSRVIKNVLLGDKERARQIVYQLGGDLKLKPRACEDTMTYDVSEIYSAVGSVAKSVFTQKEIEDGVRVYSCCQGSRISNRRCR